MNGLRSFLYLLAALLGDVQAIRRGPQAIQRRIVRRCWQVIWEVSEVRANLTPGTNVDRVNLDAGMAEMTACGWKDTDDNARVRLTVEYALRRWSMGEEAAAQRQATDVAHYGIDLTSWLRILAAAKAGVTR